MRIQNNIMALNTHRMLGINQANQMKSTEKLSSGYRINRAADDAAGLSISEKMRAQIRGLNRAAMNAQDGISMIQAAEGALQETHAILQRMRELAVQGANDINAPEDRVAIINELEQLAHELDRIADSTNFNGMYILSGAYGANESHEDLFPEDSLREYLMNPSLAEDLAYGELGPINLQIGANTLFSDFVSVFITGVNAANLLNFAAEENMFWQMPEGYGELGGWVETEELGEIVEATEYWGTFGIEGAGLPESEGEHIWNIATFRGFINVLDGLGPDGSRHEPADDESRPTGIALVSKIRSELGAMQNRLEHTLSNLYTVAENMTAAESRIRDVDMAREMMNFTKQNILNQAATAMLAQANMVPQTVLQLLQ